MVIPDRREAISGGSLQCLHVPPVTSPVEAVRAAIVAEHKSPMTSQRAWLLVVVAALIVAAWMARIEVTPFTDSGRVRSMGHGSVAFSGAGMWS